VSEWQGQPCPSDCAFNRVHSRRLHLTRKELQCPDLIAEMRVLAGNPRDLEAINRFTELFTE